MSRFTPLYLLRSARCLATPVAGSFVLLGLFASTSQPVHADAPPSAHPFDIPSKKPKAQVFFDEDGKPCKACTSFSSYLKNGPPSFPKKSAKGGEGRVEGGSRPAGAAGAVGGGSLATLGLRTEEEVAEMRKNCPPDIEELGRSTWTLLHTLASSLPLNPSPLQQTHAANLLLSLTVLYPCPHCRADFAAKVEAAGGESGVREAVKTRAGAERWVWERHEEVNKKLGKEGGLTFEEVRKRWKEGGEGCGW